MRVCLIPKVKENVVRPQHQQSDANRTAKFKRLCAVYNALVRVALLLLLAGTAWAAIGSTADAVNCCLDCWLASSRGCLRGRHDFFFWGVELLFLVQRATCSLFFF